MHEPLTTQLVAERMRDLLTAFPSRHAGQNIAHTAEVYRNGLRGISGESFRAAVDVSIKTDQYFPKIARLRELANEWERRNRVTMAVSNPPAWNRCAVCGAEAVLRGGEAQARDERGALLWDGPEPRMVATPERWTMQHKPLPHGIRAESAEAAD